MSNPLQLLAKLRRFQGDPKSYLETEYRQNLKAIEDAFLNTEKSISSVQSSVLAGFNYSLSSDVASYSNNTGSYTHAASLSITTSGGPVILAFINSSAAGNMEFGISVINIGVNQAQFKYLRDTTSICELIQDTRSAAWLAFDVPAAGTYTYKFQGKKTFGAGPIAAIATNFRLLAIELA